MLGAGQLGEREAALERLAVVAVALDDEHGTAHARADRLDLLAVRGDRFGVVHHQELAPDRRARRRRRPRSASSNAARGTSRRRRTRGSRAGRRGCECRFSFSQPSGASRSSSKVSCAATRHGWPGTRCGTPRGERDEAEHALRVRGGDLDRGPDTVAADAGEHGRLGRRGVHHREAVGRAPAVQPRACGVRAVGAPVPAAVIDDDAMVAGEVVHLRLPDAGVADRGRRQEHDRRLAAAVDLPVQPQAVVRLRVPASSGSRARVPVSVIGTAPMLWAHRRRSPQGTPLIVSR